MTSETPAEAWARCRPWLEAAVARSDSPDMAEVERRIAAGRAWFWPTPRAAAVTELTRDCNLWLAGGDLEQILEAHPSVEAWAREQACHRLTMSGRPGWARVMAPLGYRPMTYLVKEL